MAINANRTGEQEKKKFTYDLSLNLTKPYPQLLYDVRRSVTPLLVKADYYWQLLTYKSTVVNVDNWMNISTGLNLPI